jgi:chaperone required for assembly of F1-ATPase
MAKLDEGEVPRRFYKAAVSEPFNGGFAVLLDGRIAKTPKGEALAAPTEALGRMLAEEWDAQGETIRYASMPTVRLAMTAIDQTGRVREAVADEVARFAGSDLVCYLAEEPPALVEREAAAWGPWLAWFRDALAVPLTPATGISPKPQSPEALARVKALALELDDFALSGLAYGAALFGSAVLGFAVAKGALSAAEAFELSRIDEAFQEERWGIDAEAAERTERLRLEALMLGRWFGALA